MTRATVAFFATVAVLFLGITVAKRRRNAGEPNAVAGVRSAADRQRVLRFWDRYREATAYRTEGRIREAADAYAEALALDDGHEDALYYYGSMLFELGDFSGAEDAWRRLVAVNDASARAHSRLGELYLCHERSKWFDLSAAEARFRRAAEINPEETGPLLHLAESALLRGDLTDAQTRLDEVLRTNHGSMEAHFLRGYVSWRLGLTGDLAARAAEIAALVPDRETEREGLNEGDTRSGSAMLATPDLCRGVRDLVEDLGRGAAPVTERYLTSLYQRADSLLAGAGQPAP